jgi:hypothetical protein
MKYDPMFIREKILRGFLGQANECTSKLPVRINKGQLEEYESGSQVSTGFTLVELPQVSTGFTGHKAKRPVSHLSTGSGVDRRSGCSNSCLDTPTSSDSRDSSLDLTICAKRRHAKVLPKL